MAGRQLDGTWSAPGWQLVCMIVVEWVSREKVGLVRSNPQTPNPLENSVEK